LPVRNSADTLEEALDSIRAQTLTDFEVIAVDDGSDDGSFEMLTAAAGRDLRFRIHRSPKRGLVPALNHGVSAARCTLIARMDADDRMHPRRLHRQLDYLHHPPRTDVLGSRVRVFPEESLTDGMREYIAWLNGCTSAESIAQDIYLESPLAHPSVMFRRQVIQASGCYRDGPFPEDYDLWLRLIAEGKRLEKLPEVLLDWRDRPDRTSRTDPRCAREAFDRLRVAHLARDPRILANRDNLAIWGAGRATRKRAEALLGEGFRPVAWIDIDQKKIGNRLDGVPVVNPQWLQRKDRPFLLCYVAAHGARRLIERALENLGYRKGKDYLNVG
jgi:glycosyltransferase involved in cell wall biosynthesis